MPSLSRFNARSLLAFGHDVAAALAAWCLAYWLRLNLDIPAEWVDGLIAALIVCVPIQAAAFYGFGLYRGVWRFASLPDLQRILFAVATGAVAGPFALLMLKLNGGVPRAVFLLEPLLLVLIMGGSRFTYRSWKEHRLFGATLSQGQPVLVIGTGDAAVTLVKELARSPDWRVTGLIAHDPKLTGSVLQEIRVVGSLDAIAGQTRTLGATHAIIARPDATARERRRIVEACHQAGLKVLTVPSLADLMSGKVQMSAVRRVDLDDLLGREPVVLDNAGLTAQLAGQTVLITGAGGSIGSELVRQIARFAPARLVLLDNGEFPLYTIEQELARTAEAPPHTCVIADVRDSVRMHAVMQQHRPAVVFHAAAYKHVPMMENDNAWEALTNNTLGTYVAGRAAIAAGVGKFVLISTDKAVNPANVMGASKRLAELVCQALDASRAAHSALSSALPTVPPSPPPSVASPVSARAGSAVSTAVSGAVSSTATRFVMVRFGNVLGSTGSVIPAFREQIARGGPISVTHPDIVRYFMSIPEAAQLVLQAGLMGQGGEIFVLDMGDPVKIVDLAREMIRLSGLADDEIRIEFTGLRPGEKLYEELLTDGEATLPTPHAKLRVARPGETPAHDWLEPVLGWLRAQPHPDEGSIKQGLKRLIPEYTPQALDRAVPAVDGVTPAVDETTPAPLPSRIKA